MLFRQHVMFGDVWTIIGVGEAILGLGGIAYRELRSDIRGLQNNVSTLRERISGLAGPSYGQLPQSGGDDNAKA